MKKFLFVIIAAHMSMIACAQETKDSVAFNTVSGSAISILADVDSSVVFLDTDSVGITPLTIPTVKPGHHRIKIVSRDVTNWLSEPITDSIFVEPSHPQTLRYIFNRKILIISSPTGAEIFSGDSLLGTTPLVLKTELPSLRLKRSGYEETPVDALAAQRGILSIKLNKVWQSHADSSIFRDSDERHSSLRLYLAGAATILAGATTAYFKVKADNSYSQYVATGNSSQLSDVNRLDVAAGIALAATQISLGLFTYFILSE